MQKMLLCTLLSAALSPLGLPRAAEAEPPTPPARERHERPEENTRPPQAEVRREEPRRPREGLREVRPLAELEPLRQRQRERAELTAWLERLRAEGRREEAALLQKHIRQLDRRIAQSRLRPPPHVPLGPPTPKGWPGPDTVARQHHLQAAIDNLRAAGLPEVAERLERAREDLLWRKGLPGPELAERVREEIQRLRAELEEVRQHLRRLEERLERAPRPAR